MSKTLNLYKVQSEGWRNAEYSAANHQIEAITNLADDFPDIIPNRCSVVYVGKIYINENPQRAEELYLVDKAIDETNGRLKDDR